MSRHDIKHAERYALNATKVYLMDFYKIRYPEFFRDATIETRKATLDDYYVPPSLADQCIVVTETKFGEKGCERISCFSRKENLEPCGEGDGPQWIGIGNRFGLACQPSCRQQREEMKIDAMWHHSKKCVIANPLKKILALFPEKLFEKQKLQQYHRGLDVIDDRLRLNRRYCMAYGLDYVEWKQDCNLTLAQKIGEFFVSSTVYRSIKTSKLTKDTSLSKPTELPDYLMYDATPPPPKRIKRNLVVDYDAVLESLDDLDTPGSLEIVQEVTANILADTGIDAGRTAVKHLLKTKVPKLLARAGNNVGMKTAFGNLVAKSILKTAGKVAARAAISVSIVGGVYQLFSFVTDILDSFDPYGYNGVLNKSALDRVDMNLDYAYYGDGKRHPELTPEYVWDNDILVINDDELEKHVTYLAERVNEYLEALNKTSDEQKRVLKRIDFRPKNTVPHVRGWLQTGIIAIMILLIMACVEWIHIWTFCLLFLLLHFNN
jgi:hypothetical protein